MAATFEDAFAEWRDNGSPDIPDGFDWPIDCALTKLVNELSQWVDGNLGEASDRERLWMRVTKVSEESGEVIQALVNYTGGNPRRTGSLADVEVELLDAALAALCAVAHLRGNTGDPIALLAAKARGVCARAGLLLADDE